MVRYVFLTCEASNLEVLYAGFKEKDRGFLCLPYPWDPAIKEYDNNKKSTIYSNIIQTALPYINDKIHFIVYGRVFEWWSVSIPDILRNMYPECIVSCYFGDLIESHKLNIADVKRACDYVFTFDEGEASKYDIFFCQEPYSGIDSNNYEVNSDVCFIGRAKGRLKKILEMFEYLSNSGLLCDFYIAEAPINERKYADIIHYDQFLTYGEVVKHIKRNRCILEIMQNNALSPSTRFAEALVYNKILLTDCRINMRDEIPNVYYFDKASDCIVSNIFKEREYDNSKWINFFSIDEMIKTIGRVEKNEKDCFMGGFN